MVLQLYKTSILQFYYIKIILFIYLFVSADSSTQEIHTELTA